MIKTAAATGADQERIKTKKRVPQERRAGIISKHL